MSNAVISETGQPRGATTAHIPPWICKGGATTRLAGFADDPLGLSVFVSVPSLFLGRRSILDMFPRHALAESQIHLSGAAQSFLTGC